MIVAAGHINSSEFYSSARDLDFEHFVSGRGSEDTAAMVLLACSVLPKGLLRIGAPWLEFGLHMSDFVLLIILSAK